MDGATGTNTPTRGFHCLMEGATLLRCSQSADAIIEHMGWPPGSDYNGSDGNRGA